MFFRELSKLFRILNNEPRLVIRHDLASQFASLIEVDVLKKTYKDYVVDLEELVKLASRALGIRINDFGTYAHRSIGWVKEQINKSISLILFWTFTNTDDLVTCVHDLFDGYTIPIIITPSIYVNELHSNYNRLLRVLTSLTLYSSQVLLLFPVILPLPIIARKGRSNKNFFAEYRNVISTLRNYARELGELGSLDEYDFIVNYRRQLVTKSLASFAFLHDLLDKYGIALMREEKKWSKPSKWFEEVTKLLLVDTFVRGSFNTRIVKYLTYKYRTGGRGQEDIAIPIRRGNTVDIYIIDTKLWKRDVCKALLSRKEPIAKYQKYIIPKNKSKKLKKLEQLVKQDACHIDNYHLIFIQRKKASQYCIRKLYDNIKIQFYKELKIYGISEFACSILKGNL